MLDFLGEEDPDLVAAPDKLDLQATLQHLDSVERAIICLRLDSGLTQAATAHRLGISQMHVSRLERNALGKLKVIMCDRATAEVPS